MNTAHAEVGSSYVWSCIVLLCEIHMCSDLPLGLVGGVRGLGELLGGGGEPLLGALQVLLEELDASVQRGDLALGLKDGRKKEFRTVPTDAFQGTRQNSKTLQHA